MKYLLIPVLFLLSFSFTSACSFGPGADRAQPLESNISKYPTIIVATVTKVVQHEQSAGRTYEFTIAKTLKGEHQAVRKISTPGHSCGSWYEEGRVGVFFLHEDATTIQEGNPQYYYKSIEEALDAGNNAFEIATESTKPKDCTKEFKPVCGEVAVQCIQAPCLGVKETFNNRCLLEERGANFVHEGSCTTSVVKENTVIKIKPTLQEEVEKIQEVTTSFQGPTTDPLDQFVGPTTPPPVEVTKEVIEKRSKIKIILNWYRLQIRGLLSWFL